MLSEKTAIRQAVEPRGERPRFSPGYGVDRSRTDAMIDWGHVVSRLTSSRNYWLATAGAGGRPHVAPVWGVWYDNTFYFSTDPNSRKGRDISDEPETVVHLESGDDVVILEGRTERLLDRETIAQMSALYAVKYDGIKPEPDNPAHGVYRLRPHTIFAWVEKDFPGTATRWEL